MTTRFGQQVPRLHPQVEVQRVGGRLLAAGPGDVLHTFEDEGGGWSEVGERIVELSDGRRTVEEIARQLCLEFEVEPERCAADTERFVRLLAERQVLVVEEQT